MCNLLSMKWCSVVFIFGVIFWLLVFIDCCKVCRFLLVLLRFCCSVLSCFWVCSLVLWWSVFMWVNGCFVWFCECRLISVFELER